MTDSMGEIIRQRQPVVNLCQGLEDRLRNLDGGGLSPSRLTEALKATHDDRMVLPGSFRLVPIYEERGPVPMREDWWRRLAYAKLELAGFRHTTIRMLSDQGIGDMAQLLLHTEKELHDKLVPVCRSRVERYLKDVRYVLKKHNLRLATQEELDANADFFVKLRASGEAEDPSLEIRVAWFMLDELEMCRVRSLFGVYDAWPYEMANLVTLGDLLALSAEEVTALWHGYCGEDRAREWPYASDSGVSEMFERVREEGIIAVTEFLRRNNLTLAG